MSIPNKLKAAVFALAVSAVSPTLFADVDLNTYIHSGSTDRPLSGTTTSAEGTLGGTFDSFWRRVVEDVFNGRFSTFKPGLLIIVG